METLNAQDVAAIWFVIVFGFALLSPVLGWTFRAVWNMGR